jgi:hypothetical protein
MNLIHHCRTATVISGFLLCGLASAVSLGPLAGVASAATSPTITVPAATVGIDLPVAGSGFTPGGQVHLEVDSGTVGVPSTSTNVVASEPTSTLVCGYGVKPSCHEVTVPGGQFHTTVALSNTGCGSAAGTVKATDLSTGSVVSEPIVWTTMC